MTRRRGGVAIKLGPDDKLVCRQVDYTATITLSDMKMPDGGDMYDMVVMSTGNDIRTWHESVEGLKRQFKTHYNNGDRMKWKLEANGR